MGLAGLLRPATAPSKELQAIAAIRNGGGFVAIEGEESDALAPWLGSKHFGPITEVEVFRPATADAALWDTGILAHPEALQVLRAPLDDDDLERLAPFCNLRTLDLCGGRVSNEGLVHLKGLGRLERLAIRGSSYRYKTESLRSMIPEFGICASSLVCGSWSSTTRRSRTPAWRTSADCRRSARYASRERESPMAASSMSGNWGD